MIRVIEPGRESIDNMHRLAEQIKADYQEQELPLPTLVGIPRSSYIMLDAISRHWAVDGVDILHACVKKEEMPDGRTVFRVGQFPAPELVRDKELLVVDAVCKTGKTLGYVRDRLLWLGASGVKTAVLYDKDKGNEPIVHKPDFCIASGVNHFTLFEWEVDLPEHPVNYVPPEETPTDKSI